MKRAIYIGPAIEKRSLFLNYGITGELVPQEGLVSPNRKPTRNTRAFQPDGQKVVVIVPLDHLYLTEA
jgi:hypothetical protein